MHDPTITSQDELRKALSSDSNFELDKDTVDRFIQSVRVYCGEDQVKESKCNTFTVKAEQDSRLLRLTISKKEGVAGGISRAFCCQWLD